LLNEQGQLQYAGSVDELKRNIDFNWLLGDSAAQANKGERITKDKTKPKPSANPATDATAAALQEVDLTAQLQADAARQMGDSTVYKFYIESAGWPTLITFIIAIIVFAFCDSFPSKSISLDSGSLSILIAFSPRRLAQMVGRVKCRTS
jgi:hypothetical protein